jgi:putative ABC transport system permease protein
VHELFGIPMNALLIILLVGLGAALGLTAALAVRNPILVKLGTRNVGRRRGRSALIVVGLMLGTTIIAAALTTGDTMSHTIRQTAVRSLGNTDEVVSAKGATDDIAVSSARPPACATSWRTPSSGWSVRCAAPAWSTG